MISNFQNSLMSKGMGLLLILCLMTLPTLVQAQEATTTPPSAERVAEIQTMAKADAQVAQGGNAFVWGCLLGAIGILVAISTVPEAPVEKMLNMNASEQALYRQAYQESLKKRRLNSSLGGCATASGIYLLINLAALGAA